MSTGVSSSLIDRLKLALPPADRGLFLGSLGVQLLLGLLFGHQYDMRIFMATGYLAGTGQNPYVAQDLTAVFANPAFQGMTSIGYPPPWALILGAIYLLSYNLFHNLLWYNLAIKLPIIFANLWLAFLVKDILLSQQAGSGTARRAWIFLLFNPFLLYVTTAWGQFDSVVAALTLLSLVMLDRQRIMPSAILLALAISLKPTPMVVGLAALAYLWKMPRKTIFQYLAAFTIALVALCVLPFILFRWDITPILDGWNTQFTVSGGMSLTTYYESLRDTYQLPGKWWLLGVLWLPASLAVALLLKTGRYGFVPLLKNSLVLVLVFFLTRTWLSEQNLVLVLPIVLILVSLGELPQPVLTILWVVPLLFTVINTSPPQLLFPLLPDLMSKLLVWMDIFRPGRLFARMLMVIPWQLLGWWLVYHGLRQTPPVVHET